MMMLRICILALLLCSLAGCVSGPQGPLLASAVGEAANGGVPLSLATPGPPGTDVRGWLPRVRPGEEGMLLPPVLRRYRLEEVIAEARRANPERCARIEALIEALPNPNRDERLVTRQALLDIGYDAIPFLCDQMVDLLWTAGLHRYLGVPGRRLPNDFLLKQSEITIILRDFRHRHGQDRIQWYVNDLVWERCVRGWIGSPWLFDVLLGDILALNVGERERGAG